MRNRSLTTRIHSHLKLAEALSIGIVAASLTWFLPPVIAGEDSPQAIAIGTSAKLDCRLYAKNAEDNVRAAASVSSSDSERGYLSCRRGQSVLAEASYLCNGGNFSNPDKLPPPRTAELFCGPAP